MRRHILIRLAAIIGLSILACSPSFTANLLTNGDFSDGESGWTRWQAPWSAENQWDTSSGFAHLTGSNGSFGWYQAISTVPGYTYTINCLWTGNSQSYFWNAVLFFNDDGRPIYDQLDAPLNSSLLAKVDGWGMNSPAVFGWKSPFDGTQWYPAGLHTNSITATGTTMYVGLQAGTVAGFPRAVDLSFDDIVVGGPVPEPSSLLALGAGLMSLMAFRRRR